MTLAHEYGHFLCDRHKPGVDYLQEDRRRSASERFAEPFGLSFLMPRSGVSNLFYNIVGTTGDFQVGDLCSLSSYFFVSVQAMALRLEDLGHLPKGAWDHLNEMGFRPAEAKRDLGVKPLLEEPVDPYPERYKFLAVSAFRKELISEGQLARFLRADRVTAREIVESTLTRSEVDPQGNRQVLQLPFEQSLLISPS
jgi:Zn-dependent peptidase ImmA (M78 family)